MNVKKLSLWIVTLLFGLAGSAFAAEEDSTTGVITGVDRAAQTITIRDERTGRARTYFLDAGTRVSSKGNPIGLERLRKGQTVTLRYRSTDRGREIVGLRLPDPEDIVDVIPFEISEEYTLSGRVTGKRVSKRTLTIRDDESKRRLTLRVPETTRISRDGETLRLNDIYPGDRISARYRVTEEGLILVTGRAPEPSSSDTAAPLAQLPKTAGQTYVLLVWAFGLFAAAGIVRRYRQRAH